MVLENQRQGLFAQAPRRTDKTQRNRPLLATVADRDSRRSDLVELDRVEGGRLDMQAVGVDHLEDQLLRLDHLPDHGVARGKHAADRCDQCLAPGEATADRGDPPLEAGDFGFGGIDILLRHGIGQLLEPGDALFG